MDGNFAQVVSGEDDELIELGSNYVINNMTDTIQDEEVEDYVCVTNNHHTETKTHDTEANKARMVPGEEDEDFVCLDNSEVTDVIQDGEAGDGSYIDNDHGVIADSETCQEELTNAISDNITSDFTGSSGDRRSIDVTKWQRTVQVCDRQNEKPVTLEIFNKHFDEDGRVTDEDAIREQIFKGGIHPDARKEVWKFLFGLYSFSSTRLERETLDRERAVRYFALRSCWQAKLKDSDANQDTSVVDITPEPLFNIISKQVQEQMSEYYQNEDHRDFQQQLQYNYLFTDATLFALQQPFDNDLTCEAIRIIDKDVPRTDRKIPFYSCEEGEKRLQSLRNILITFAAFHPDVNYAQGMNDVLSRFLVVLESEVDAFWCFTYFMEKVEGDFHANGMLLKIASAKRLLMVLDNKLYEFLEDFNASDLMVCHRWLLLAFKREFAFEDGLKIFEIIYSGHLEPHSFEGTMAIEQQRILETERDGGCIQNLVVDINADFTFDVFLCVAILMQFRSKILEVTDAVEILACLNSLTVSVELNTVLEVAECLFFIYCRTTVRDSFEVVQMRGNDEMWK